jgi:hypothetical protein
MTKIIIRILSGLGDFILLSHRISGKNNKAKNIEATRGINIKDNIFNK